MPSVHLVVLGTQKTHFLSLKMYNIIIIIEFGGIATALRWSDSDTLTRIFFFSLSQKFFYSFLLCGEFIKKRYLRIVDIISFSFILFFFPGDEYTTYNVYK
jgi:hypothetical protein